MKKSNVAILNIKLPSLGLAVLFLTLGNAFAKAGPDAPVAQAALEAETTFHTTNGLRFADEDTYEAQLAKAQSLDEQASVLKKFGDHYGLDLFIRDGYLGNYASQVAKWGYLKDADAAKLKSYAAMFIDEWSKYPKAWIKVSGLKTIALVDNLVVGGQGRAAMPDPEGHVLFLQVESPSRREDDYFRGVIHHEFDHEIEYNLFDSFSRTDEKWTANNVPGFHYGKGGAAAYDGVFVNSIHPQPGFVTKYGTMGIEEDKAEIYAYLFTSARYRVLKDWVRGDPGLSAKVAQYKELIKEKVPLMDDAYFDEINPIKI